MGNKRLIGLGFMLIVLALGGYYFLGRKRDDEGLIPDERRSDICVDQHDELPWTDEYVALPWYDLFTDLSADEAMHLGDTKAMGWFKGNNMRASMRTFTLYSNQLKNYAEGTNVLKTWDVVEGEFLCS